MSAPWVPIGLPESYTAENAFVYFDSIVIWGSCPGSRSRIFVRERGSRVISAVDLGDGFAVKDLLVSHSLGVFVLVAFEAGASGRMTSWDRFRVVQLDVTTAQLRPILSGDEWELLQGSFPVKFLGCAPDGVRLAVACGQHISPANMPALDYRVGYLDPKSGRLELAEQLAGFIF